MRANHAVYFVQEMQDILTPKSSSVAIQTDNELICFVLHLKKTILGLYCLAFLEQVCYGIYAEELFPPFHVLLYIQS